MPNKTAAKKSFRKAGRQYARNEQVRFRIAYLTKQITKATAGQDSKQALELLKQLQQTLDKAAKRHVIHPNTAARTKSRVAVRVNKIGK